MLPDLMEVEKGICQDCSPRDIDQDEVTQSGGQRAKDQKEDEQSKFPPLNEINRLAASKRENAHENSRNPFFIETDSDSTTKSPVQSFKEASLDDATHIYIQPNLPNSDRSFPEFDIFALGWYDSNNYQKDKYSAKIISFAKEEDMQELAYFESSLNSFFEKRVETKYLPESMTIYPSHDGGVSNSMVQLVENVVSNREVEYKQYLTRSEPRPRQRDQEYSDRLENQLDSISVQQDIDNETIFLLDDIVTSGSSMAVGAKTLLENGADEVIGICLGVSDTGQDAKRLSKDHQTINSVINDT